MYLHDPREKHGPLSVSYIEMVSGCKMISEFNEKKDNKQCLSDTPCWSMKKTNIKNTKAIQNG